MPLVLFAPTGLPLYCLWVFFMSSGIYRLYWKDSGYYYYGQAKDLRKRKNIHFCHLRNEKHFNIKLQRIYNKYGFPEFEIIELCETINLNEREQFYISIYFKEDKCCNLSPTASSCLGVKRTEETKRKLSEVKKGVPSLRKGVFGIVKQSEKTKLKHKINNTGVGNPFYGKHHSAETKEKLRKINQHPDRLKKSINNLKLITKESTEKGRLNRIGWKQTEDAKKRIKESLKKTYKIKKIMKNRFKKTGQFYLF